MSAGSDAAGRTRGGSAAEVDFADLVRVVVEQRDNVVRVFRLDENLFRDRAANRFIVVIATEIVNTGTMLIAIVHMAADAEAALRDEALLAGLFAAHVMK